MSIRCANCESRLPESEAEDGRCPECVGEEEIEEY